jgi:hypothetical protein
MTPEENLKLQNEALDAWGKTADKKNLIKDGQFLWESARNQFVTNYIYEAGMKAERDRLAKIPDAEMLLTADEFSNIALEYTLEICGSNPIREFNQTELCWRLLKAQLAKVAPIYAAKLEEQLESKDKIIIELEAERDIIATNKEDYFSHLQAQEAARKEVGETLLDIYDSSERDKRLANLETAISKLVKGESLK